MCGGKREGGEVSKGNWDFSEYGVCCVGGEIEGDRGVCGRTVESMEKKLETIKERKLIVY